MCLQNRRLVKLLYDFRDLACKTLIQIIPTLKPKTVATIVPACHYRITSNSRCLSFSTLKTTPVITLPAAHSSMTMECKLTSVYM